MMIYGVGYHILPKFSGTVIYSTRIMVLQFWAANIGLVGMAIFWPMHILGTSPAVAGPSLMISASLSFIAALLFAFNILKTIKPVQM
jgi:cbb3-type cytochrome oxidase subunit 1